MVDLWFCSSYLNFYNLVKYKFELNQSINKSVRPIYLPFYIESNGKPLWFLYTESGYLGFQTAMEGCYFKTIPYNLWNMSWWTISLIYMLYDYASTLYIYQIWIKLSS